MERSWLDEERTDRIYKSTSNPDIFFRVVNEYQTVKCQHCEEKFYCRLTHIYEGGIQNLALKEYHTNYSEILDKLQELRVAGDNTFSLFEKNVNGVWMIYKDDEIIGKEVS